MASRHRLVPFSSVEEMSCFRTKLSINSFFIGELKEMQENSDPSRGISSLFVHIYVTCSVAALSATGSACKFPSSLGNLEIALGFPRILMLFISP